jgi:hypothetical protein
MPAGYADCWRRTFWRRPIPDDDVIDAGSDFWTYLCMNLTPCFMHQSHALFGAGESRSAIEAISDSVELAISQTSQNASSSLTCGANPFRSQNTTVLSHASLLLRTVNAIKLIPLRYLLDCWGPFEGKASAPKVPQWTDFKLETGLIPDIDIVCHRDCKPDRPSPSARHTSHRPATGSAESRVKSTPHLG